MVKMECLEMKFVGQDLDHTHQYEFYYETTKSTDLTDYCAECDRQSPKRSCSHLRNCTVFDK